MHTHHARICQRVVMIGLCLIWALAGGHRSAYGTTSYTVQAGSFDQRVTAPQPMKTYERRVLRITFGEPELGDQAEIPVTPTFDFQNIQIESTAVPPKARHTSQPQDVLVSQASQHQEVVPVPEPASGILVSLGILTGALYLRRKRLSHVAHPRRGVHNQFNQHKRREAE